MEIVLLAFMVVAYIVAGSIIYCYRHEAVMLHMRNPRKYTMEKIYFIIGLVWALAPISVFWLVYEVWNEDK